MDRKLLKAISQNAENLQDQNEDLILLLKQIESWEQDLEKTKNGKGLPQMNQKLWNRWKELQTERNRILNFYQ
jgi:hypothetical protein